MSQRKHRLSECNPKWGVDGSGGEHERRWITFDCPSGHKDCSHSIPFTPSLDGTVLPSPQSNHAVWERKGDTFETLTLTPSILRRRRHESREAAIAAGCIPEYVTESMLCALHIFIKDGAIEFCGDSK